MVAVSHRVWRSGVLARGPIYLDSSVIFAHLEIDDRFHGPSLRFLGDHAVAHITLQVSVLALDEVVWRLARTLVAKQRHQRPSSLGLAQVLKREGPGVLVPHMSALRTAVNRITTIAELVKTPAQPQALVDTWLDRIPDIGGNHDAMHLAIAQYVGAATIVTSDADYQRVKRLPFSVEIVRLKAPN